MLEFSTDDLIGTMDFRSLNQLLNELFGKHNVTFEDLLDELMQGNLNSFKELFFQYAKDVVCSDFLQCKNLFLGIFFLGIFALLLNGMSDLLSAQSGASGRLAYFSGYFIFLFASIILMKTFMISYRECLTFMSEMKSFCGLLMPALCMVLGIAGGPVTATAFYEFQLFLIFIIENVMTLLVMPMVQLVCVLHVLNQLPDGNRFGGIISLLKRSVVFLTRSAIFASIAGSLLQAGLMPEIDGTRSKLLIKTVSLIPGLGDYATAITETILRGSILVKNSIGFIGIFILFMMCFKPAIATLMYGFVTRAASAILQISGEKKYTAHVWKMADCFFLLTRVQLFCGGMFFVSIAVAILGMNAG